MPPSQLKQLKASLRETGVLGQQQSKKKKRQNAQSGAAAQNRAQRNAALQGIRERFNPFEVKAPVKSAKFDVTTRDAVSKGAGGAGHVRPGVTKSMGEERRRQTLLRDLHSKNRVGGIMDRRFGENDPTMTPEQRAAERFARENERKFRKESLFNLEDEEDEEIQLTHGGQSLSFDNMGDDFQETDLHEDDASDGEKSRKRRRIVDGEEDDMDGLADEDEEEQPERKKSKQEVMKEVIAKSKFYKYERQKAKEDDDDLREQLDKGLPDLFEMMRGTAPKPKPEPPKEDTAAMNPDRAALLNAKDDEEANREYDQRLKQLTFDKRSQPADRTKTEEEKAEEEARRLKELEEERLRRMRGSQESESESEEEANESEDESIPDDAKTFGLIQPAADADGAPELGVEDEDDFIIDEDLVETDSNASLSFIESDEDESPGESEDEEEDEMINGLTLPVEDTAKATSVDGSQVADKGAAYTYPCPENHQHFLEIVKNVPIQELPTVIQRIRALHHHRLHPDNKSKLSRFAAILVEHVAYLGDQPDHPPFAILENILRHIHSLAKSHPESVAKAFRAHLRTVTAQRPLKLTPGDLIILTGVSTVFPTSDHFHAVSTPSNLVLARYLGQGSIDDLADLATGAYAASLVLKYQDLSKRYIPEFVNYALNALCVLSPTEPKSKLGFFPSRQLSQSLRLVPKKTTKIRQLKFWDIVEADQSQNSTEELKLSIIATFISLLDTAANMWTDRTAFREIFEQIQRVLEHVQKSCSNKVPVAVQDRVQTLIDKLDNLISQATLKRRPLLLHNHRPLAIKTSIPKFEENFNPDRHYDPDRERAESNRLKAEYKREKKGAMRELRKDANFIAREQLREKKERDAAYEKKYRRLIAEIQGEEGKESKAYERERKLRQGKK
ncbi:rRNA maturation protein (Nop14), putative [Paecilomyces variotii No. 5]|uniref:rRNA maturation protein (Nop14), putative n=1 Tax=Byssochlamys spectabilis (strain No. 5 / NBRC 109023) TaxID=1356009 RepID=V5HT43_BYSSN|nr:rRNA maturation protein (Nop14), putative [Paecilomyces variotii No. 5]